LSAEYKDLPAPAVLSGLEMGSTIHYKLVADNETGPESVGKEMVVTTGWSGLNQEGIGQSPGELSCVSVSNCALFANVKFANGLWQSEAVKAPAGGSSPFAGPVTCVSASWCASVGSFKNSGGVRKPLGAIWNGTGWTGYEIPLPEGAEVPFWESIDCASTTSCEAVGYTGSSSKIFTAHWSGTAWTNTTPSYSGGIASLTGVSCASSTACFAVGWWYNTAKFHYEPLMYQWNGSAWSAVTPPAGGEAERWLEGISCGSTIDCVAVGLTGPGHAGEEPKNPLALHWNGTTWSVELPPKPAWHEATEMRLQGVSCFSSTNCLAVGWDNKGLPFAERKSGSTWSVQAVPLPETAYQGHLLNVSCPGTNACVALGRWKTAGGEWKGLAECFCWMPLTNTKAASSVGVTAATLNGGVNPNGKEAKYWFEYGTTTAYGTKTAETSAGSGTTESSYTKEVTGLTEATTYHFRIVASGGEGLSYGPDMTFETKGGFAGPLAAMPVLDPFNGNAAAESDFSKDWTALGWAGGFFNKKGTDHSNGWGPFEAFSTVNGAYFKTSYSDTGSGVASVATMAVSPSNVERYFALWIDMPNPGGANKEGYELWVRQDEGGLYGAGLYKWVGGTLTELSQQTGLTFSAGNSFAIVDKGSTVSLWVDKGSGFTELLSASDSTFSNGKVGVQGSGNITRLTNFKAGSL
jgi:hypothetical protein